MYVCMYVCLQHCVSYYRRVYVCMYACNTMSHTTDVYMYVCMLATLCLDTLKVVPAHTASWGTNGALQIPMKISPENVIRVILEM